MSACLILGGAAIILRLAPQVAAEPFSSVICGSPVGQPQS
jgi:hypothetical protein